MAIPSKNVLGNPNVTEGNFQIAIEQLRESVIGSGKTYDSANTYMAYDICYYNGAVYYSKINNNIGNTPSIGANWGDYADLLLGVVHKTGNETIAGVKTFSSSPIVPNATTATQAIAYGQAVKNTGNETKTGTMTFMDNVGIGGTPSPWSSLGNVTAYSIGSNTIQFLLGANAYYNSGYKYASSGVASQYEQYDGIHTWKSALSGIAGNSITWTNAMTLDTYGQLTLAAGINGLFKTQKDSSNYSYLRTYDVPDTTIIYTNVIASSTKSAILANGSFQSATNSYGSTSDAKLKENIVDTSPKLDKLMQVQVRNFNYIGDEHKQIGVVAQEIEQIFPSIVYETKDTKQVEVRKTRQVIDKEAVLNKDGSILEEATYKYEEYIDIETVETGETTKNVKYSVIYMMMIKALQEQQEIINDLKARVEVLEAKNA